MATTKLFEQIPNTLNNYKDTQLNQPSLAKTVFNNGTIVAMPKEIYQHLSKYSGCIFNNIHEYISYDDIAKLIYINDQLALCDCYKDKIYHDVPEGTKVNVDFLLNTNTLKESVTNYLNSANSTGICYELATIGNTIVVIVREGFLYSLKDNTQKVAFLKDLYETSFNVMGESIASSKPFFLELVDTL